MKKTLIYIFLCIFAVVLFSIMLFEISLQSLPYIYRLIHKSDDIQYVYVLGESSAVGAPYEKISYSKILKALIKNYKINNREIKLIHLEQSGCRLYHQYVNYVIYRYLHPTQSGIMLLYVGTNNWANKEVYSDLKRKLLLKSSVYQLLDKYIGFLKFDDYEFDSYDFQYEYEKIVLLAKKFGEDIYMSTISGNYEFPPDTNSTPIENEEIDKLYFNRDYNQAKQLCIRYLEDEKYNDKSQFWYRLGMILKEENRIKEANKTLFNSVMYCHGDNPTLFQNEVIRDIAKKYNIPLFDFFEQLCNSNKIIGFDFFVDTIHPNIETHIDIAYGFIDLLSRKYNFIFTKKEDLDIEKLKDILRFNNNDMARVLMSRIIELKDRSKYAIKFNERTYIKWKKELEEIKVDEDLLPNREYINKFLDFENKFESFKNLYTTKDENFERLKNYKEETYSSYYFDFVNFGANSNSKLRSI